MADAPDAPDASEPRRSRLRSRRDVLIGGAVVGAGAVAAGVAAAVSPANPPPISTDLTAKRVERLPGDDPGAGGWRSARTVRVELDAQLIAMPTRPRPVRPTIEVDALHDGTTIAFRLVWRDFERDDLTVRCDGFRDACAVLVAPNADQALRIMGTADAPVTLLHWKADWQRDVDAGRQELGAVHRNASADYYPPLPAGSGSDISAAQYVKAGATPWLPGLAAGNPLAALERSSPVEKLLATGFGTAATARTQNATGRGVYEGGKWRVTLTRPLAPADDGEAALHPGGEYGVAFAIWSGADDDVGSKKSPSKALLRLRVEP
jgi:DMSO reductase family type II enzyme heme b subunit